MTNREKVNIAGREYYLDELSEHARAQVTNLRVVAEEIRKIEQKLAIYKTAQAAYARALRDELAKQEGAPAVSH